MLLGAAYLCLYCGFSSVGQVHRTKRLLTVQVALEHGEETVGSCLSLCTQNQETAHRPGCSGTWERCCWELPTSMFTVGSALWARYTEPRDCSPSRLLWNMGKMLLGAAYLYAHRTKRLLTVQVALEQHGEDAVGSHLVQHATQELAGDADAVAWDDHVAGKTTHFACKQVEKQCSMHVNRFKNKAVSMYIRLKSMQFVCKMGLKKCSLYRDRFENDALCM